MGCLLLFYLFSILEIIKRAVQVEKEFYIDIAKDNEGDSEATQPVGDMASLLSPT